MLSICIRANTCTHSVHMCLPVQTPVHTVRAVCTCVYTLLSALHHVIQMSSVLDTYISLCTEGHVDGRTMILNFLKVVMYSSQSCFKISSQAEQVLRLG